MRHLLTSVFFAVWVLSPTSSFAGLLDSAETIWQETKDVGNNAWDASKDAGKKAWDASREVGENALDASKQAIEVTTRKLKEARVQPPPTQQSKEEKFSEMWGDILKRLEDGLQTFDNIKDAPDATFLGEDKKSLRNDFNETLEEIITLLDDAGIREDRSQIDTLRDHVEAAKKDISRLREERVIAPQDHRVKTTKSDYDRKIAEAEQEIVQFEREMEKVHFRLIERLRLVGLDLDLNQVSVLLARVDSENIIQMSVVFDVLRNITKQLMVLTQNSGEEIKTAKKYYGMHVVLIEMVLYMQNKYVDKINTVFLPKISKIMEQTLSLSHATKRNISRESDSSRSQIYKKNLQAQALTLKVVRLYMDNLKSQRDKVVKARRKAMDDFRLANNTYETVSISANLVDLLSSSQDSFEAVMNLQVPEIVPFENLEMQRKFQELSKMIQSE